VTNARGEVIATIDPLTRERRSPTGRLEAVLTPQGWTAYRVDLDQRGAPRGTSISIPPRRPPHPDYDATSRRDRDPRR
jgi:hypothetical protein